MVTTRERIGYLMGRGNGLAIAMEKWTRTGIWVVTRSDPDYPQHLKQRLKTESPPVLFGCGNRKLLKNGGLSVVGSRNASQEDLSFAVELGKRAAGEGKTVISGGARGIDEAAMLGALGVEGTVIGILADSLLKTVTSAKYRQGLMDDNLLLLSPFYPEAGFNAGNAMSRNKYIYCLSDAAVVVHSGKKGGTWNGALENLKAGWVPLWVKPGKDPDSGNRLLVDKGGRWCSEKTGDIRFDTLFLPFPSSSGEKNLFTESPLPQEKNGEEAPSSSLVEEGKSPVPLEELSIYKFFLEKLKQTAGKKAKKVDELQEELGIEKGQLTTWLKQAVEDGKATRLNKPVRYMFSNTLNLT